MRPVALTPSLTQKIIVDDRPQAFVVSLQVSVQESEQVYLCSEI